MGGQPALSQQAQSRDMLHRARTVTLSYVGHLVSALRQMVRHRRVEPHGQFVGQTKRFRRAGIAGVGCGDHPDQRVGLPAPHRRLRVLKRLGGRGKVGRLEIDDGLAQPAAQAGFADRPRDVILKIIHVDDGGRPAADHFGAAEQARLIYEARVDQLGLKRKDVPAEPGHQLHVVRHTPHGIHGDVRVQIDQPGQNPPVAQPLRPASPHLPSDRLQLPDRDNGVAADRNGAGFPDGHLRVHGHDMVRYDQQVDRLLVSRPQTGCTSQQGGTDNQNNP